MHSLMWPKTARDVQMVLTFHWSEHQEKQFLIARLAPKVSIDHSSLIVSAVGGSLVRHAHLFNFQSSGQYLNGES